VVTCVKETLEKINTISRQLVLALSSRLLSPTLAAQNTPQENHRSQAIAEPLTTEPVPDEPVSEDKLNELMTQRQHLISALFDQHSTEAIAIELNLLNEMITLDAQLTEQSLACKQALADQVLQLKKSTKVSQSYQKY